VLGLRLIQAARGICGRDGLCAVPFFRCQLKGHLIRRTARRPALPNRNRAPRKAKEDTAAADFVPHLNELLREAELRSCREGKRTQSCCPFGTSGQASSLKLKKCSSTGAQRPLKSLLTRNKRVAAQSGSFLRVRALPPRFLLRGFGRSVCCQANRYSPCRRYELH
jgi:hypothetical protein